MLKINHYLYLPIHMKLISHHALPVTSMEAPFAVLSMIAEAQAREGHERLP